MTTPQFINYIIEKTGLSQKDIAEKLNLRQPTITDWKNGQKISLDKAFEICDTFNIKMPSK